MRDGARERERERREGGDLILGSERKGRVDAHDRHHPRVLVCATGIRVWW